MKLHSFKVRIAVTGAQICTPNDKHILADEHCGTERGGESLQIVELLRHVSFFFFFKCSIIILQ